VGFERAQEGPEVRNWLTTHYPHYEPDVEPWHIYLQRQYKHAVDGIAVGDRVFFYEFATRRARKDRAQKPDGAQGVVRVGFVAGPLFKNTEGTTEYDDGGDAEWCWEVPADRFEVDGFVARERLCELLGYKRNYTFRGFSGGTGVKQIGAMQADQLLSAFRRREAKDA